MIDCLFSILFNLFKKRKVFAKLGDGQTYFYKPTLCGYVANRFEEYDEFV